MMSSKARRMALDAAKSAVERAGSLKGAHACALAVAYALLELAYQIGRLADQVPVYGPPDDSTG